MKKVINKMNLILFAKIMDGDFEDVYFSDYSDFDKAIADVVIRSAY